MTHFTADWFTKYAPQWLERMGYLKDKEIHALEIGSYEGRSTCWILDNILTHKDSTITCVDPWDGGDVLLGDNTKKARELFVSNTKRYGSKVIEEIGYSSVVIPELIVNDRMFDLIFVDGDHEGATALLDLVMSWQLLKNSGHLVFDDYQWGSSKLRTNPKVAWDAFVSVRPLGLMWEIDGRQVFARKEI
jgi:predicted O-methyltransferase YrrM